MDSFCAPRSGLLQSHRKPAFLSLTTAVGSGGAGDGDVPKWRLLRSPALAVCAFGVKTKAAQVQVFSTFTTSRSLYAGEFFGAAIPGSSRLPWLSLSLTSSALPCSPSGANISTLQGSLYVTGCGFALPFRRIQRFSTISHPIALVACYVASWQLPRLDFHQLDLPPESF